MKTNLLLVITLIISLLTSSLTAQVITTIAGNGTVGYTGNNGPASNALLYEPNQIAFDQSGNLFIAEDGNNVVRKISPSGIITSVAGNGTQGFSGDSSLAINAQLDRATAVAVDLAGNVYVCDADNFRIRKVDVAGIITTIAGTGVEGHSGDGGLATAAEIGFASGLQVDAAGNIYIAIQNNSYSVRKINTAGIITTIAGNGTSGFSGDGGLATAAQLTSASSICFDPAGNLYIADFGGHRIRKVNTSGIISTIAGTGVAGASGDGGLATNAKLFLPYGLVMDALGNLYFCDAGNSKIRKIDAAGIITTFAGVGGFFGGYSGDGGLATNAELRNPSAIALDASGNVYIGDFANHAIRKVTMVTAIQTLKPSDLEAAIYPNPTKGNLFVETTNNSINSIQVFNAIGLLVYEQEVKNEKNAIDLSKLPEGVYIVSLKSDQGIINKKITKN